MTKNNLKVVKTTKAQQAEGNEKNKALDAAIAQITDNFGKGSVMKLGQRKAMDVESVSTGSLSLDLALGIGGLPKGRVVEVYGPESSGKTTLALQVVAEAQKAGGICAFVDAEHALDPVYAKKLGVDTEELLISQPDTGEQALEIADTLVKSGSVSVIVVDSVAALTPRAEIEGEMGDHHVGLQSRLMSQALRKLTGSISSTNTMMIFINQIRLQYLHQVFLHKLGLTRALHQQMHKFPQLFELQQQLVMLMLFYLKIQAHKLQQLFLLVNHLFQALCLSLKNQLILTQHPLLFFDQVSSLNLFQNYL